MKNRIALLPALALGLAALACNFEQQAAPTLNEQQIQTLSAQTLIAIQWQTLSAGGNTPGGGPDATATVEIPAGTATNTVLPSVTMTGTLAPTSSFTPTVTNTPVPCNWAQFVSDITIPDNWETAPLDHFTKTWRLRNIGSCTWTSGYSLIFDHGDQMGAPASQQLTTGTVAPGGSIDVSVNLLSPAAAGTYQGFFKLRASDSSVFGIGAAADTAFWVKIKVVAAPAPAPGIESVLTQVSVAAGGVGPADAVCPAGSVVVSGGFAAGNNMIIYSQYKQGNGWRVYGKNNSGSSQLLNAYALCLSNTAGSTQQILKQVTVAAGEVGYDTAVCPAGSIVTGGGFASNPAAHWVYNSSKGGNGWSAYAKNNSGAGALFNIYAICLSGAGGSTSQVGEQITVSGGSSSGGEAQCPAGKLVTGGGYALSNNLTVYNSSRKSADHSKWNVFSRNSGGGGALMNIYAICWTP
jgi:hypothetical protein